MVGCKSFVTWLSCLAVIVRVGPGDAAAAAHAALFRSPHVVHVDTLSINATVQEATRLGLDLLVVFYDAEAVSFDKLAQSIDKAADDFAEREQQGKLLARLAVCDVMRNGFLATYLVPEIRERTQQFRGFDAQSRFPPFLVHFSEGIKVGEMRGVADADSLSKALVDFVRFFRLSRGGLHIKSAERLRQLLQATGRERLMLIGCGFKEGSMELEQLRNGTRGVLHSRFVLVWTDAAICTSLVGPPEVPSDRPCPLHWVARYENSHRLLQLRKLLGCREDGTCRRDRLEAAELELDDDEAPPSGQFAFDPDFISNATALRAWVWPEAPPKEAYGTDDEDESQEAADDEGEEELEPQRGTAPRVKLPRPPPADALLAEVWDGFWTLEANMMMLRRSVETAHGGRMSFNFSAMDEVLETTELRPVLNSVAAVAEALAEKGELEALKRRLLDISNFSQELQKESFPPEVAARLRQLATDGFGQLRATYGALYQQLHALDAAGALGPRAVLQPVERRSIHDLSMREFVERYAKPGVPVILTDAVVNAGTKVWDVSFFKQVCPNVLVRVKRRQKGLQEWAQLRGADLLPLHEFLDTYVTNKTRRSWYLHDWSLSGNCPLAMGPPPFADFVVPKYFASDYTQRVPHYHYLSSWPSLFVGSNDTESALHIDNGATHFWLHLLDGRKSWRIYARGQLVNLYPAAMNHVALGVDAFDIDEARYPLIKYAKGWSCEQAPGELIYIPGDSAHAVRNLVDSVGLSANFVDHANLHRHLWHNVMLSRMLRPLDLFGRGDFAQGWRSEQEALTFGEFKSTDWSSLSYDLF